MRAQVINSSDTDCYLEWNEQDVMKNNLCIFISSKIQV